MESLTVVLLLLGAFRFGGAQDTFTIRTFGDQRMCIGIKDKSTANGGETSLSVCNPDFWQFQWYTVPSKNAGYVNIYTKNGKNKCLSISGSEARNKVYQWDCTDIPAQQWQILPSNLCSSVVYLKNARAQQFCATVTNLGLLAGNGIMQWNCVEHFTQQFVMRPTSSVQNSISSTTAAYEM